MLVERLGPDKTIYEPEGYNLGVGRVCYDTIETVREVDCSSVWFFETLNSILNLEFYFVIFIFAVKQCSNANPKLCVDIEGDQRSWPFIRQGATDFVSNI